MSLQYAVAASCALAVVAGVAVFTYLNLGNSEDSLADNARFYAVQAGNWQSSEVWEGEAIPPDGNIEHDIEILAKVTQRGHLSYRKGAKRTLIIKDTLVVEGNFTLGHKANLSVEQGGVLMVAGDLVVDKKSEMTNYGTIAVGGQWVAYAPKKITYLGDSSRLFYLGNDVRSEGRAPFGKDGLALQKAYADLYTEVKQKSDALKPILFTATPQQGYVTMRWVAEGVTAHYAFTVERSSNGMIFNSLTTLGGADGGPTAHQYAFTDKEVNNGIAYYRLKRTDHEGETVYSKMVMVINQAV